MIRVEDYGFAVLEPREAAAARGGTFGVVQFGIAVATAAGAGFVWGYDNLGPVLNKYI